MSLSNATLALLALRSAAGGTRRRAELAARLAGPSVALELCECSGWAPGPRHWHEAGRQQAALRALGITVVPVWCLPPRLRSATPLPPALFVRGDPTLLSAPAIGIVGARRAHVSALAWARERAAVAAGMQIAVVSGGALGVDAAAHGGSLSAGGRTLAYLGVPCDHIYPALNRSLFERMLEAGGALVSEHPPGVTTYRGDHAMRNRFIAAQARILLVAEAGAGSGSLGTADWARRYQVPVLVSPPGVGAERAGIEELLAARRATVWPGSWAGAGA